MKNQLKNFKIFAFVIILTELITMVGLATLLFFKLVNFSKIFTNTQIFIGLSLVVIIDIIIIWVSIIQFEKVRRRNELKAAELIGQDIQEAYNFGMIGLLVVDHNNKVLWVNDLFKERQIDILDVNILEWQPTLSQLTEGDVSQTVKILLNNRNYEVKFLKDAGLYIFKDTTDLETITDYSNRQAIVVGQIVIDNYSDIFDEGDDSDDLITQVRNKILEYCKINNCLIRKVRNDAYLLICNHESLKKMEKEKFSLLNEVRMLGEKEVIPPTLSIGIAYDFPDILKLNDMANSAIEIAMSRGGDQVIISQYGQDLLFFGGKSIAQENRNKVKVRVMSDSVISLIKNSSNVLIMGHVNMDMDALGACLGMKAICDYCGKDARIIYDPKKTERKTKGAITSSFSKDEISRNMYSEAEGLNELRTNTLVIVCDVHKPSMTMSQKIVEKASKIIIIDHHRRGEEFIESSVFANIDTSSSSTSEIVAEFIHYSSLNPKITMSPEFATIMLSGIFLDSNYFKSTTSGSRTFEASMILKDFGADNAKADDFLKDEFEEYALITKIVSTMKTPEFGVVYCVADDEDIIESSTLAKVANQCMQMKGINACFVIGRTGAEEVKISCRSDGSINVQMIAEKLSGGGHFTQAAITFVKISIAQAETKLLNCLNEYLGEARK